MLGLQKDSKIKEEIIKIDEHTATRYKVVQETIDLDALRKEKEALEAQLAEKEPSVEELVEWGKDTHGYYSEKRMAEERITNINEVLNKVG